MTTKLPRDRKSNDRIPVEKQPKTTPAPKKTGQKKKRALRSSDGSQSGTPPTTPLAGGNPAVLLAEKKKKKAKEKPVIYDASEPWKPFPNGFVLYALKNGVYRECRILEKKKLENGDEKSMVKIEPGESGQPAYDHPYEYYIHYTEWDRRMDEWVLRPALALKEEIKQKQAIVVPQSSETIKEVEEVEEDIKEVEKVEEPVYRSGALKATIPTTPQPQPPENKTKPTLAGKGKGKGGKGKGKMDETGDPQGGQHSGHGNFTEEEIKMHEEATKVKNIDKIIIGRYEMVTWYYSPFPVEYNKFKTLYFCEFCLAFYGHSSEHARHIRKCKIKYPPGNEIYRSQEHNVCISVFEIDGVREKVYCQNLCYIAKLFLDHKTLEFDCTPFLFYVLCEVDSRGCHVVGYFSKEKKSVANYNLACILTLPCHQRKGYGKFLISLSYELSKIEQKVGSPEKPISDLGKISYLSYWSRVVLELFKAKKSGDQLTIEELSRQTCITPADIIETLKHLKILVWYKGKWVFSFTQLTNVLRERDAAKKRMAAVPRDPTAIYVAPCRPELLHWTPFFVSKRQRTQ